MAVLPCAASAPLLAVPGTRGGCQGASLPAPEAHHACWRPIQRTMPHSLVVPAELSAYQVGAEPLFLNCHILFHSAQLSAGVAP